jgi:mannitol-1-phosphate/altronate dehydrogenase
MKKILTLGSGVMILGTHGISELAEGGLKRQMFIIESNGYERAAELRRAARVGPAFRIIECGNELDGGLIDNTYNFENFGGAYSSLALCDDDDIFSIAADPDCNVWFTNQGEAGFNADTFGDADLWPQPSLAAQLTVLLQHRWSELEEPCPITIMCWELIEDNGPKMQDKVVELARRMQLEEEFIAWLQSNEVFFPANVQNLICVKAFRQEHSASDGSVPFAGIEPPSMWAIVVEEPQKGQIPPFPRELPFVEYMPRDEVAAVFRTKNRLLNATHVALVARWLHEGWNTQFETVYDAMQHEGVLPWLQDLGAEIILVNRDQLIRAEEFFAGVLHRFQNPWLGHNLADICSGITSGKWEVRVKPTLQLPGIDSCPHLRAIDNQHRENLTTGVYAPFQRK